MKGDKKRGIKAVCMILAGCSMFAFSACKHQHKYEQAWTFDETYHWHEPICDDTTEPGSKQVHNFIDGVCTLCKYKDPNYKPPVSNPDKPDDPPDGPDNPGEEEGDLVFSRSFDEENNFIGYSVAARTRDISGDIVIPEMYKNYEVTNIAPEGFNYCLSLESIFIPKTIKTIGYSAFYGCQNLTEVKFDEDVQFKEISEYLFCDCISLKSFTFPDSVEVIHQRAFGNCANLETLTWGLGLKRFDIQNNLMGSLPFAECEKLNRINIKDIVAWCAMDFGSPTNNGLFINPLKTAKNIYIDDQLVTKLVIPEGVKKINRYVFMGASFTEIVIPDSVESIGSEAFWEASLKKAEIGSGVTEIAYMAFADCEGLEITLAGGQAQWEEIKTSSGDYRGFQLGWGNEGITLKSKDGTWTETNVK